MQEKQQSLAPGALIGDRFEVRELLGAGGFGMTYRGWDRQLACEVAIKEYLPLEFAARAEGDTSVHVHSSRAEEYRYGLNRFLDEARTLARFKHPNVVRVVNFLEANGTAYLVMDFEEGQSLSQYLRRSPGPVPEARLRAIAEAVLRGLAAVHAQGFLHRDLKPGNIYLRRDGEALLIDFGAARQAIGQQSRSVTGIVSAGYAPTEQYGTDPKKQGPWTDLYGLGATLYRCLSGKDPVDAPTRRDAVHDGDGDPLAPAQEIGRGRYSPALLAAIDACLRLPIRERPQSAQEVQALIAGAGGPVPEVVAPEPRSTVVTERVADAGFRRPAATNSAPVVQARAAAAPQAASPPARGAPAGGPATPPAQASPLLDTAVRSDRPAVRWAIGAGVTVLVVLLAVLSGLPQRLVGPDPEVEALRETLIRLESGADSPFAALASEERDYTGSTERDALARHWVFESAARKEATEAMAAAGAALEKGDVADARTQYERARSRAEQLLALLPRIDAVLQQLATYEGLSRDIEQLAKAEKRDPATVLRSAAGRADAGRTALAAGRLDEAESAYREAAEGATVAWNTMIGELSRGYASVAERALQAKLLEEAEFALARAKQLEAMQR